jgi:membrane glycosyltransferase
MPGLKFVSRFQLAFAMLMFLSSPAWIGLLVISTLALAFSDPSVQFIRPAAGQALLAIVLVMWFAPKIATALDVMTRAAQRKSFGGTVRFLVGFAVDAVFTILLLPIMWLCHTMFIAGMPFGRSIGWIGQVRDDHSVPWSAASRQLWPHTAIGLGAIAMLAATHPGAIPYALFLAGGLALSIPFAVITAMPRVGRALVRIGIGRLPEETKPPIALKTLALPALAGVTPAA